MDIWLIGSKDWAKVHPVSIHGMLWLQTHFTAEHWDSLAANLVKLPLDDVKTLSDDANEAGLKLNYLQSVPTAIKI